VPGRLVGVQRGERRKASMNFPGSLTHRQDERRTRRTVLPNVRAIFHASDLDQELAAGLRPSTSPAHRARANHLTRRYVRCRIAAALNRAVDDAFRPTSPSSSQVPLCRDGVRRCSEQVRELASQVATKESPHVRGIAIAFQLAFDGRSAMFHQPGSGDGAEHLANTLQAARMALRVSPEL
jgi:hypothetical protein